MRFQLAIGALGLAAALGVARADDLTVPLAVHDAGFEPAQVSTPSGSGSR
jgi:hypothetical protein